MRATERNRWRHRHLSCFPPSTVPRPMMKGWENFPSTPLLGGKAYWQETKIITCFPYYKWQQIKARCTNCVAFRLADFAGDAHWGRSDVLNWLLGLVGPYRVTEAMWLFCITSKIIRCSPKQKVDPNGLVLFGDDDLWSTTGFSTGCPRRSWILSHLLYVVHVSVCESALSRLMTSGILNSQRW